MHINWHSRRYNRPEELTFFGRFFFRLWLFEPFFFSCTLYRNQNKSQNHSQKSIGNNAHSEQNTHTQSESEPDADNWRLLCFAALSPPLPTGFFFFLANDNNSCKYFRKNDSHYSDWCMTCAAWHNQCILRKKCSKGAHLCLSVGHCDRSTINFVVVGDA